MKIGLLGGTFNPIHYGHLINAEIVRDNFQLDKILFIPSRHPVHKNLDSNVSSEDRFNMVKLAISGNKSFSVSRIELDREGRSYTIITVKQLLDYYKKAELYLIIGADSFKDIRIWKDSEELLQIVPLIVMRRNGFDKISNAINKIAKEVRYSDNPLIDISSSVIRERINKNKSIKYLVPLKVEKYIEKKGLYKS